LLKGKKRRRRSVVLRGFGGTGETGRAGGCIESSCALAQGACKAFASAGATLPLSCCSCSAVDVVALLHDSAALLSPTTKSSLSTPTSTPSSPSKRSLTPERRCPCEANATQLSLFLNTRRYKDEGTGCVIVSSVYSRDQTCSKSGRKGRSPRRNGQEFQYQHNYLKGGTGISAGKRRRRRCSYGTIRGCLN
jgi:hypothetical protein